MKENTNNIYKLLCGGYDWDREKTIESYKLLYNIIYSEFDINECNKSDLKSAFKNMSELLYSEGSMTNEQGEENEARDTILEICKKLKVLTPDQIEITVKSIYRP